MRSAMRQMSAQAERPIKAKATFKQRVRKLTRRSGGRSLEQVVERLRSYVLGLQRLLDRGSYRTAWTMLHKLRSAMVHPARERLLG